VVGVGLNIILIPSFRRRPESRNVNNTLDSGLRWNDEKKSSAVRHNPLIMYGLCLSGIFLSGVVFAQPVTPFFSSNQSPIIQIHNLPAVDSANVLPAGNARYRLVNDLASNYTFRTTSNESVLFDGETIRSAFVYTRGMGKAWEWGVQIPYLDHSGGSLDSFIEDWHDTFGLPQGGRNTAPHNRLRYFYQRNGVTRLSLTESSAGIGDLRLTTGWQSPDIDQHTRLAIRSSLSLPTGDSDQLQGSGAAELALWASAQRDQSLFDFPGTIFGGGGVLLMSKGDVLTDQQRRIAVFGSVGAGARVLPWMSLKLQADFHSAIYEKSSLEQINANVVQLLMGGDLQIGKQTQVDIMVSEDVTVHASPDVVFHIALSFSH
jgi:hypothetical protein